MNRSFALSAAIFAVGLVTTLACTPTPSDSPAATARPADSSTATAAADTVDVDPAVVTALQKMTAHLGTLKTFEVRTRSTIDEVMDDGQKYQFEGTATYRVRRPDAFFIDVRSDRRIREFYYDGKTFTMFAPRMNVFAEVTAPPTIAEMIGVLSNDYGIDLPLTDLFTWGAEPDDITALNSAKHVGFGRVDGVDCEHYAFRQEDVDWQVWIQRGDNPLPRKLVITTRDDPAFPQYSAILDWKADAMIDAGEFDFKPPSSTLRIAMAKVSDPTP
jgi:hypothetical protein